MTKATYSLTTVTDGDEAKIDPKTVPWWTSSRLGLAVLGFFGFVNVYALRVNLSVAIVCMVNGTALKKASASANNDTQSTQNTDGSCGLLDLNATAVKEFEDGEFLWDKTTQGLILSSFFWGYLVTQIPGGWIATKLGGKRVFGFSMLLATIATFFTPIAAQTSYLFLLVLRVILGICSGTCFPAMHALWGQWAPPLERSKLTAFTYAGAQVGNVITFPLAGMLCKYGFAGGWPSIFYVLGALSGIWFFLWMFIVSDSPNAHKRISKEEKEYITQSLAKSSHSENGKSLNVPWRDIFTSPPVYAIIISNVACDWGGYTLLTNIPSYMKEVLKFDITTNGLYSALPYIAFWGIINVSGWVADFVQGKCLTTGQTRKLFDGLGKVIPALMLIGLGYVDCSSPILAITLLTLAVSLTGMQFSGFLVNHVDIAPPFAGILFGLSNMMGSITGFISPTVVGIITDKGQSRTEWQIVFYIAAGIYLFGALFYVIFGSGDLQPWARESKTHEEVPLGTMKEHMLLNDKGEETNDDKNNGELC